MSNRSSIINIPISVHVHASSVEQASVVNAASSTTFSPSHSDIFGTTRMTHLRICFLVVAPVATHIIFAHQFVSPHGNQFGICDSPLLHRVNRLLPNALHLDLGLLEDKVVAVGFKHGVRLFGNQNFLVWTFGANARSFVNCRPNE